MLFKSLIRSVFDYSFVILSTSTQRIMCRLQKLQNKILKLIKFFKFRTKTSQIHENLNIQMLKSRTAQLFSRFIKTRISHTQINNEINTYKMENQHLTNKRFKKPYDNIIEQQNL